MAEVSPIVFAKWFKGARALPYWLVTSNGIPIDVSSWTFRFVIAKSSDPDSSALITKTSVTVSNGNGTNDKVRIVIDSADSSNLRPGIYYYTLWRTDLADDVVLAVGDAYLSPTVQ
jgi:hypothetical protein